MPKRPNSRRNLDIAIERIAGRGQDFVQARTVMADAVVAQMLPDGAVKGGSALKLRFGDEGTRFSEDLDTARTSDTGVSFDAVDCLLPLVPQRSRSLPGSAGRNHHADFTLCSCGSFHRFRTHGRSGLLWKLP